MENSLTVKTGISINAARHNVWQALTDPRLIKQYLFNADVESDWQKGSSITYSGEWEGKSYQDRGKVIEIVPEQLLHITYLSSSSNKEDKPENYANVIYSLSEEDGTTVISVTEDNIENDEQLRNCEQNWNNVLENMKRLLEK